MSSSGAPCENNMQLPSLDEIDQSEKAEDDSFDDEEFEQEDEASSNARSFFPALLPTDEAGPSKNNDYREQAQYIPPDVRHDQNSRSSLFDQLPNSLGEQTIEEPVIHSQNIGPALPPGFSLNEANEDEEDPEDPGDPEDPEESGTKPSLPRFPNERRLGGIGPALPPCFSEAPSLPDEEIRISCASLSSTVVPPPEPESVRNVSWGQLTNDIKHAKTNHLGLGPSLDILPNMPNSEHIIGHRIEESENEAYGPALPPELVQGTCQRASSIEIPVEGDEHSNHNQDDCIVGPLPPKQEQLVTAEEDYRARLLEYRLSHGETDAKSLKREEWMLQLPKKMLSYGLGARTFSSKGSNSVDGELGKEIWTETPSQRQKRLIGVSTDEAGPSGMSWEAKRNAERDAAQEKQAEELNKDRNLSMLEMHQRKRKTETSETECDKKIRQPFDRERDMEVRGLRGETNVSEVKERMGKLASRFACSSARKYL